LGNGLTEEAHTSLVTPMSWPEDTHFGFGPSVYTKVSPAAKSFATYVHCLVHRREAFNMGEFGMVGWQNANYWSNAVIKSTGAKDLPHALVPTDWQRLQNINMVGPELGGRDAGSRNVFSSQAVHQLCAPVCAPRNLAKLRVRERVPRWSSGLLMLPGWLDIAAF
jgi:hypothetical protein